MEPESIVWGGGAVWQTAIVNEYSICHCLRVGLGLGRGRNDTTA